MDEQFKLVKNFISIDAKGNRINLEYRAVEITDEIFEVEKARTMGWK